MFAVRAKLQPDSSLRQRVLLATATVLLIAADTANAQSASTAPPAPSAQTPVKHVDLPKQPLSSALNRVARQAGVEIEFDPAAVRNKTARDLRGDCTVEDALAELLEGTNLTFKRTDSGVYLVSVKVAAEGGLPDVGIPEVIVTAHPWTLNADISRSMDDPQPYVVITHDDIVKGGAISLDQFFRDNLTVDAGAATADQANLATGQGITSVNLRGLGANATLILIDGRRVPSVSNLNDANAGLLGQTQLAAIPVDAIERIEILASSASGIYGSNAAGGVINIILRRDYEGVQMTATVGGTYNGGASDQRLDVTGGTHLEDGRTKISFAASYAHSDPLLLGQRDFLQRGREHLLEVDPNYWTTVGEGLGQVVLGATPNIESTDSDNLVLKNGTSLGSPITYLPRGYTAADGVVPLIANAGHYNFGLSPDANGAGSPLLLGSRSLSGTFAAEREFTSWLRAYISVLAFDTRTAAPTSAVPMTLTLPSTAPNNPFRQDILVTEPALGEDKEQDVDSGAYSLVGGAIVKLPFRWQAILDGSISETRYWLESDYGNIDAQTSLGILNGTINILQDPHVAPLPYSLYQFPAQKIAPSHATGDTISLRLAGPIPFRFPGGEPIVTLLAEHDDTHLDSIRTISDANPVTSLPPGAADATLLTLAQVTAAETSLQSYIPGRGQTIESAYGEMRLPIIDAHNSVLLVESLELQVAARYDRYDEKATVGPSSTGVVSSSIICQGNNGPLTPMQLAAPCPPISQVLTTGGSIRGTFNPSVSLKWQMDYDVAFRASYATGFIPPLLNQLTPDAPISFPTALFTRSGFSLFQARDPLRGNEVIGSTVPTVTFIAGGNPNVEPERSRTWSAGVILTPHWISELRVSVDWTHIVELNNYFAPPALLFQPLTPTGQAEFNAFMQEHPERFTRGAPSGGFSVGPITGIDATIANAIGAQTDALDVTAQYLWRFQGKGTLEFSSNATYIEDLKFQTAPGVAPQDFADVAGGGFEVAGSSNALIDAATSTADIGGLRLRGNAAVTWSTDRWAVGTRLRYYGPYYFDVNHGYAPPGQGASSVPSQTYVDLFCGYELRHDIGLRLVVNDLFNTAPPFDTSNYYSQFGDYYSRFGDPRMGSYYLSLTTKF
jgi:iron complex outermembrane receptor protein